jgi:hypothetical protein
MTVAPMLRTLSLCWHMTWRAVVTTAIIMAVWVLLVSVFDPRPYAGLALVPVIFVPLVASFALLLGTPIGLVLGLITSRWFDPPRSARRYRQLLPALGALAGLVTAVSTAPLNITFAWRPTSTADLVETGLALACVAGAGWWVGWWGSRAHLAAITREADIIPSSN